MKMTSISADWRKLLLANYEVDPKLLQPYLPYHTHIALWDDKCYVSLVGFLFLKVKLAGIPVPFHRNFVEINLRFYVRREFQNEWRYGVVFVREIVALPMVSLIAKNIAKENYNTMPVRHRLVKTNDDLFLQYRWKEDEWHSMEIHADPSPIPMLENSDEDFLTSQHWGYTKVTADKTFEYSVAHPKWMMYKTKEYNIDVNFGKLYGDQFRFLNTKTPESVFLAEGSEIFMQKENTIKRNRKGSQG